MIKTGRIKFALADGEIGDECITLLFPVHNVPETCFVCEAVKETAADNIIDFMRDHLETYDGVECCPVEFWPDNVDDMIEAIMSCEYDGDAGVVENVGDWIDRNFDSGDAKMYKDRLFK